MTRVNWDDESEMRWENGLDRGMLYVNGVGVPWNGLVAVTRNVVGGEVTRVAYDGRVNGILVGTEAFQATIEAYTYPDEFEPCQGNRTLAPGLRASGQSRKAFDLCWRTSIGSRLNGDDEAYRLHFVWACKALPVTRSSRTKNDAASTDNFQWTIEAKQTAQGLYKPTSYFSVTTDEADDSKLFTLENIIYGNPLVDPRIPDQAELISILD